MIMADFETVGLSVVVVQDDQIVYNQSLGLKDQENNIPLGQDDLFRIASISKSFSVVAIMQLIEAGKVTLDTDVNELVPFRVRNPRFPEVPITLRMLLSHTSSINDSQRYGSLDIINPATNSDYAKSYSDYAPGTEYRYSNLNFNMVGAIIERLSGERFDNYIKQHILNPLDLYGGFNVDSLDSTRFARIYTHEADRGEYRYRPAAYTPPARSWMDNYQLGYTAPHFSPTGGMKISARDLARYMMMHMNHGVSPENGNRVMSVASARLMHSSAVEIDSVARYGLGIRISDILIPGKTMIGHTGSAYGLFSSMFFNREENFGFVVITNGSRRATDHGMSAVLRAVNGALHDHFIKKSSPTALVDQVVVRRTEYGVPHIHADNVEAAGFAMAYVQMEDYGTWVTNALLRARGEYAKFHNLSGQSLQNQLDTDAAARLRYQRAIETFPNLEKRTVDLLKGYATGVNRYIELHRDKFPKWLKADFTAMDVHARSITSHSSDKVKKFVDAFKAREKRGAFHDDLSQMNTWSSLAQHDHDVDFHPEAGSNVWALAPSRTTSGNAILMRNPHLTWGSPYYEAHFIIKDEFDFYGDFRIGHPLGIVGGFNQYLGWSTTNNYTDNEEIYAFAIDPAHPDHYLLDGVSHPLIEQEVTVSYRDGTAEKQASRSFITTPYGPVIHQTASHVYVVRSANEGGYLANQQYLTMMSARNLDEWKAGMRLLGRGTSNFTYADRKGNIFYVWNGAMPKLSHPSGNDTAAVYVDRSADIWSELIAWDDLPQLLNPQGGYLRNENDPFHYTNLNHVFDESQFPDNFPKAQLRLRSQLSLELVGKDDKLSLEDVVARKHDMTALLAYRVKEDLIRAVSQSRPSRNVRRALRQIEKWDNTVAAGSKGGVLFETWWKRYVRLARGNRGRVASTPESAGYAAPATALFERPWSPDAPTTTPYGLASPDLAAEAFEWAIRECEARFGGWDLAWGDVHRARRAGQDYPSGGASGELGVFRVLWFEEHGTDTKKRQIRGGDCMVWAVEFGEDGPRAYSILPYGQSRRSGSPYNADQLKMFSENQMKPVRFSEEAILENAVRTYRPGKAE